MIKEIFLRYKAQWLLAFLLILPALWNHFPLVTSDTGAYIENAYHLFLPNDRPITYSYFLLIGSFRWTLWLPVILQCLLLSFLLFAFVEIVTGRKPELLESAMIIVLTICFTSISWYTSQLMPDIFTPIIFLACMNFLYSDSSRLSKAYLLLSFVSILMHNSNLATASIFFFLIFLLSFFNSQLSFLKKKSKHLLYTALTAWILLCSLHYISGNGFKPSKSTHIFLIAKLAESGVLKKYLNDHCQDHAYKLCDYQNQLPKHAWDFIWTDNPAFVHTGYWDSSAVEYNKIIKGTLTEPKFLWMNIKESLKAGLIEFAKTDIGDGLTIQIEGSNTFGKVQEHFRRETSPYTHSKQNTQKLKFELFNQIYFITFIISFIGCIMLMLSNKIKNSIILMISFCILYCFLNALITASLSNILARLNSRCIWLIPFIFFMILTQLFFKPSKADLLKHNRH